MSDRVPLSVLLSKSLVALTREFEAEGAGRLPLPSLTMWSNVLQYVSEEGVDLGTFWRTARISKRAVRAAIHAVERYGYVVVESDAANEKRKLVRLTEGGRNTRDAMLRLFDVVDARWRKRFGPRTIDGLRRSLEALVGRLELELPHYPTGYGAADPSVGRGGQDWKAVPREPGSDVSQLPLSALLSQALMAFSLDFEASGMSHALAANVLRLVGTDGRPLDELPHATHIAGLERHGVIRLEPDPGNTKRTIVRLTARGRAARDGYPQVIERIEREWRGRYGADAIDAVRAALERIVADLDDDLPHHPSMLLSLDGR
jgi:DNA-binding MarR family transcriptional regulator